MHTDIQFDTEDKTHITFSQYLNLATFTYLGKLQTARMVEDYSSIYFNENEYFG